MMEAEWRKFYEDQRPAYRHWPEGMPTFEEFKARQIEFMRQMANQPIGDLSGFRGFGV